MLEDQKEPALVVVTERDLERAKVNPGDIVTCDLLDPRDTIMLGRHVCTVKVASIPTKVAGIESSYCQVEYMIKTARHPAKLQAIRQVQVRELHFSDEMRMALASLATDTKVKEVDLVDKGVLLQSELSGTEKIPEMLPLDDPHNLPEALETEVADEVVEEQTNMETEGDVVLEAAPEVVPEKVPEEVPMPTINPDGSEVIKDGNIFGAGAATKGGLAAKIAKRQAEQGK